MRIRIAFQPGLTGGLLRGSRPVEPGVVDLEVGHEPQEQFGDAPPPFPHRQILVNRQPIGVGQSVEVDGVLFLGVHKDDADAYTWLFENVVEGPGGRHNVVVTPFSPWSAGGQLAQLIADPIDLWIFFTQVREVGERNVAGTRVVGVDTALCNTWVDL